MGRTGLNGWHANEVAIRIGNLILRGDVHVPGQPKGIVLFAHGSGSSRHSPRNKMVAKALADAGFGTLLMDLLTSDEEAIDNRTRHLRFDIGMLADRVGAAAAWLRVQPESAGLGIGLFGASTGAAAALMAAAEHPDLVRAVVSRGGRPDLARGALAHVEAPTLLIVGGDDTQVIGLNEEAAEKLNCAHRLEIVPGATHLFEEPGALERVVQLTQAWFATWLPPPGTRVHREAH